MSINNLTGTWKREKRRNSQINETRDFPKAEGQAPGSKSTPLACWKCPKTREDPKQSAKRNKATWPKFLIEMKIAKIKIWSPEQIQMYSKGKYQDDTCME